KIANVRNSIARDLHDEIGSTLSSIALYGASAKMMLPEEHPISNVLTKINESTSSMNESMSDIVWAINTRNDKFDNIVSRMEAFANQVMEVRACKVFFETNNEVKQLDLDMEQRKNLYLLYKEIVNNAGKHSSCINLWVKLNLNNGFLNLTIKDDGKGFNTNETDAYAMGGNGLFNMKKRAAELHAEIKIDSTPGNGTEVNLKMRV
ncbi:MAG: histidine kinase, partial [Bacteroidetes bacterium]|nr:histidine kinase [Bacteroidota bacterium]